MEAVVGFAGFDDEAAALHLCDSNGLIVAEFLGGYPFFGEGDEVATAFAGLEFAEFGVFHRFTHFEGKSVDYVGIRICYA